MKKWHLLLCYLIFCFTIPMKAQEKMSLRPQNLPYTKAIKLGVFSTNFGRLQFEYEKIASDEKSTVFYIALRGLSGMNPLFAFTGGLGERYYFTSTSRNSLYAQPFVQYQYVTVNGANASIHGLGAGVLAGKRWFIAKSFGIELYAGPVYNLGFLNEGANSKQLNFWLGPLNGIWIRAGAQLTYMIK